MNIIKTTKIKRMDLLKKKKKKKEEDFVHRT
jgi:hypothetical protein